jgi:hypothetical protein
MADRPKGCPELKCLPDRGLKRQHGAVEGLGWVISIYRGHQVRG